MSNSGCTHSQRNCSLKCPKCQKFFTCRFCHDEQVISNSKQHNMPYREVSEIKCQNCGNEQPVIIMFRLVQNARNVILNLENIFALFVKYSKTMLQRIYIIVMNVGFVELPIKKNSFIVKCVVAVWQNH